MHITAPRRPVALGLALAGAVALAGGTTAAVTARATATPATHTQQVVRQVAEPSVTTPTATSPTTAAATSSPAAPAAQSPAAATQSPAAAVHPVTLAQAVALATSRTHAQLDQVETESGPAGVDYDVKLVRADGTELEVTVAAQTGQVVADDATDSDAQPSDTPESDQVGDAPDGSDG